MYYRALSPTASLYDSPPTPELVEDLVFNVIDAVEQVEMIKKTSEISAFPNPFNAMTTMKFTLAQGGTTSVKIYNLLGQQVRELINQLFTAGEHAISWDGRDDHGTQVPSGVYIARLQAIETVQSFKLALVK